MEVVKGEIFWHWKGKKKEEWKGVKMEVFKGENFDCEKEKRGTMVREQHESG